MAANRWGDVVVRGSGAEVARWPLEGTGRPDLEVVDGLARLQLAARRVGLFVGVRWPCPELQALVELAGLDRLLEVGGEPEHAEQAGVEEVVQRDDPVV